MIAASRFAEAEAALRRNLAASQEPALSHYLLAYTLLREQKPQEALAEYTLAAQRLKPNAEDLKNVGNAYALLADYPDAEHWMQQSLSLNRSDPDAWYDLGRIHFSEQRFADALASLQQALALAPSSSKVENNIGLALEGLNRNDEAIAAYRRAITLQEAESPPPVSPEQPLLNLGMALLRRGDLPEAHTRLVQAAEKAPRDPRIHEQLGKLYLQANDLASAQTELRRAVELSPEDSSLHFLLGQSYRRAGMQEKAQAEFAVASRLIGTHASPEPR